MPFNCNFHLIANGPANFLNYRHAAAQFLGGEAMSENSCSGFAAPDIDRLACMARPCERFSKLIEGPDLHRSDPLIQETSGQFSSPPLSPGAKVVVFSIADACVVNRNTIATAAAEHVVDRLTSMLASQVPQGKIEC